MQNRIDAATPSATPRTQPCRTESSRTNQDVVGEQAQKTQVVQGESTVMGYILFSNQNLKLVGFKLGSSLHRPTGSEQQRIHHNLLGHVNQPVL